jgi:hypothetical protein
MQKDWIPSPTSAPTEEAPMGKFGAPPLNPGPAEAAKTASDLIYEYRA